MALLRDNAGLLALLDLMPPQFADLAGLGLSTMVNFEKSRRDISLDAAEAIQRALEMLA
jgi:hypothetical protein